MRDTRTKPRVTERYRLACQYLGSIDRPHITSSPDGVWHSLPIWARPSIQVSIKNDLAVKFASNKQKQESIK